MVHIRNGKRFNIYAQQEIDGVTYPEFTSASLQAQLGITAVEPEVPADFSYDTYTVQEITDAPYVVYTKKSQEQLEQQANSKTVAEARAYLASTDFKMLTDYVPDPDATETLDEIKAKRSAARDTVRSLDI